MTTENTISPLRDKKGNVLPGGFVFEYLERDPKLEEEIKLFIAKDQYVAKVKEITSKERPKTTS